MTATEASRGFSDLLDAVEQGETVTVTRGGHLVAEIRPARRKSGRELRLALEAHEARGEPWLTDEDAADLLRFVEENRAELYPSASDDPWHD